MNAAEEARQAGHRRALAALLCALLGLLCLPLLGSVLAVLLGYAARRRLAAGNDRAASTQSARIANAAILLGCVGIGFWLVVLLAAPLLALLLTVDPLPAAAGLALILLSPGDPS